MLKREQARAKIGHIMNEHEYDEVIDLIADALHKLDYHYRIGQGITNAIDMVRSDLMTAEGHWLYERPGGEDGYVR